jgi:hypothetical protein
LFVVPELLLKLMFSRLFFGVNVYGVPLMCGISTQEQNCGPAEEFPKRLIHPDK